MIHVNGETKAHVDESVDELLERLGIERRGIAVALDGEIVRRAQWAMTRIVDNSTIEIVTAVAGG